jgi:hypothetical protein
VSYILSYGLFLQPGRLESCARDHLCLRSDYVSVACPRISLALVARPLQIPKLFSKTFSDDDSTTRPTSTIRHRQSPRCLPKPPRMSPRPLRRADGWLRWSYSRLSSRWNAIAQSIVPDSTMAASSIVPELLPHRSRPSWFAS